MTNDKTLEAVAYAIKNAPKEKRIVVQELRMGVDGVIAKEHETIEFVQTDESRAKAAIAAHDSELKQHIKVLVETITEVYGLTYNKKDSPEHDTQYQKIWYIAAKALHSLSQELRSL